MIKAEEDAIRSKEIGKRLREIQAKYNKDDSYMCSLLGYSPHSYSCLCNGDFLISSDKIINLCSDDNLASELPYILTGTQIRADYSLSSICAYIDSIPKESRNNLLSRLFTYALK